MKTPKVFVSATTDDLHPARQAVKESLLTLGCLPVEQTNFPPDHRTIRDMLRKKITDCDAVIHLAGRLYGAEPKTRQPGEPRRSYTQLEYDIARELGKPLYLFVTTGDYPYAGEPEADPEKRRLQEAHRQALLAADHLRYPFANLDALKLMVRELQVHVDKLRRHLEEEAAQRAAERQKTLRIAFAIFVSLALIGGGVYFLIQNQRTQGKVVNQVNKTVNQVDETILRVEARLDKERTLLAKVLREANEKIAGYENLSPKQRFDLAIDAVAAAEPGLAADDLRAMIALFVTTVENDPAADDLDRALALMARQHFDEASKLAAGVYDKEVAKMQTAQKAQQIAKEAEEHSRKRAIEAADLEGEAHFAAIRYPEALAAYRKAAALIDRETYPLAWAEAQVRVAFVLDDLAQHKEGIRLLEQIVEIREQKLGPDHPELALALNNLAQLLHATNRLAEAEPLMRRALAIDEQSYGGEHPNVATDLNNLATLLQATNRLAEAEPLMRRALVIDEQSYGGEHPDVAIQLNTLAQLLQATNRLAEAEPLMRRALAIAEQSYGGEHPDVAIQLNTLAQLLQATNRLAEAEPLMRRALAIAEHSYGGEHPDVARDLNNLAQLLQATNRLTEAEPLMRRALAINEQSYGAEHPLVATNLNNLTQLLQATNRLAEAEPLMRRALAIAEQSYGGEHPDVATGLNNLARLLQAMNRLAEAEPLYRRALAIFEQSYGAEHPNVATGLNNLAALLQDTDRLAEAEPLGRRHLEIFVLFQYATGHEHPHLRAAAGNYAAILKALHLPEDEIHKRFQAVGKVKGPLAPILPEIERLLGPARPVAEVLAALDRQYKAEGKPAVYFLPRDQPIVPHLDGLIGPAQPVAVVLAALDRQYQAEGKPAIYFLPRDQPIVPHLDGLLGPARPLAEVLAELDRQYRAEGKPPVWFLPLTEPIAPHLDELLGPAK